MSEINDLNVSAASNTGRFPELQLPSTVNNGARELEAIIARWHKDTNASVNAGGTGDAITVSANQTIAAYYDGLEIAFNATAANTTATTLNVDSVGAKKVFKHFNTELVANDIKSGQKVICIYDSDGDSSAGSWQMVSQLGNAPTTITGGDGITVTSGDVDFAPSELSDVALAATDQVVIADASDSNNPKTATASDFQSLFAADSATMETATSTTTNVTPGNMYRHPLMPKAWGYITYSSGAPTLTLSGAASGTPSVADTNTGRATITPGPTFSGTYAVVVGVLGSQATNRMFASWVPVNTTTFEIQFTNTSGSLIDPADGTGASYVVLGDI